LRKRILRTLLHEIVVDVDAEAGEIILTLHWKGGRGHGAAFTTASSRSE
jgi:hypothetical protein